MTVANKQSNNSNDQKNWLEWLVFGSSLLLLLSILGYLVYQTVTTRPGEPDIYAEAKADPSQLSPNRYQVAIYNKGGATAEEVIVEFILYKGGQEAEKSELQIAFSPKESKQEGWITFAAAPQTADSVKARVVSYKKP